MADSEALLLDGAPTKPPKPIFPLVVFGFIMVAACANILFGFENSIVASAVTDYMPGTKSDAVTVQTSFLKGAMALGATVICPFAGFAQDALGRRVTLILCCFFYLACAALTGTSPEYSAGGFAQMAAGRVLTGCVIGVFSSTVPMYISELSPPALRGALVTVNQVCVCVGILLGYLVSFAASHHWRLQFLAATPLAALSLLAFVFITPYSPRWLMSKGREEEARAVLATTLAGDAEAIEAEVARMREVLEVQQAATASGSSRYALLLQPHILWSIAIGVCGSIMQQWVGVNAVNSYAPQIFEASGSTPDQAHIQTIYIGVAKLAFVLVALALMDRVGRRPLLLWGCAGMALSCIGLAASFSIADAGTKSNTAVASLVLYMAFFEISLGPILWLLLSELYPVEVKGVAMSVGATVCWSVGAGAPHTCLLFSFIPSHALAQHCTCPPTTPPPSLCSG